MIPVDLILHLLAKLSLSSYDEITLMIHQPIEIEQALVDDIILLATLVFGDCGRPILIQAQRIDSSRLSPTSRELGGDESDAKQLGQIGFTQALQFLFEAEPTRPKLVDILSLDDI